MSFLKVGVVSFWLYLLFYFVEVHYIVVSIHLSYFINTKKLLPWQLILFVINMVTWSYSSKESVKSFTNLNSEERTKEEKEEPL